MFGIRPGLAKPWRFDAVSRCMPDRPRAVVALALTMSLLATAGRGMPSGSCITAIGDVDGDGVRDLLVSGRRPRGDECCWLVSSRRATVLGRVDSGIDQCGFGVATTGLEDVDCDGTPDFAVAASGVSCTLDTAEYPWRNDGFVDVYSGRTLELLTRIECGETTHSSAAWLAIDAAGDVDGDGSPDLLIGRPSLDVAELASCTIRSCVDGHVVRDLAKSTMQAGLPTFGSAVIGLGDLDGDGTPECAVGAPPWNGHVTRGSVFVVRGSDGAVLRTIRAPATDRSTEPLDFGRALASDGTSRCPAELLAVSSSSRRVDVVSLRSGCIVSTVRSPHGIDLLDEFGSSIDFVRSHPDGTTSAILIGANDPSADFFDNEGYVVRCDLDRTVEPVTIRAVPRRGMDVCSPGDADGDGVDDIAFVVDREMRLDVVSGRNGVTLGSLELGARRAK